MPKRKELTGKRFGHLTVTGPAGERENGYQVWNCRCDCGGEIRVNTKRLEHGMVTDCGCIPKQNARRGNRAEDLAGQRFGHLTVLRRTENRNGRTCWLCRCDCGNEKAVTAHDLKLGKAKSCGCGLCSRGRNRTDLTGRRFGRLTALEPTVRRNRKGCVCWRCVCDCGNGVTVSEDMLVQGNCMSCGCLKRENQQELANKLHRVDGTCIEILEKRKHRRDNSSGFRGVFRLKNGRYRVDIGFKGKRYYLGSYGDFEEAVSARMEAEHMIHERFLESYYRWKSMEEKGLELPFVFEVRKENGELKVYSTVENTG